MMHTSPTAASAAPQDKVLRPYQHDAVRFLLRHLAAGTKEAALVLPTGAGKSLVLATALAQGLRMKLINSVVLACPLTNIVDAFLGMEHKVTGQRTHAAGLVHILPELSLRGLWLDPRRLECSSRVLLQQHIKAVRPLHPVLLAQQNSLARLKTTALGDLRGRLLVLDEGHHSSPSATALGNFVQRWITAGGQVVYSTATPFRTDRTRIFGEDTPTFIRTVAAHAADASSGAPNDFRIDRVFLAYEATAIAHLAGSELPRDEATHGHAYEAIVQHWLESRVEVRGQLVGPKTVITVPRNGAGHWAEALTAAFAAAAPGTRVLNVVGEEKEKADHLRTTLAHERTVGRWDDSQMDVIIACGRFREGADWPLCSHTYIVGWTTSFGGIMQTWGRSFRAKNIISDYPEAFQGVASLTFFLPHAEGALLERFEKRHEAHTFVLAAYLADLSDGIAPTLREEFSARAVKAWATRRSSEAADAVEDAANAFSLDEHTRGIGLAALARMELERSDLSVGAAVDATLGAEALSTAGKLAALLALADGAVKGADDAPAEAARRLAQRAVAEALEGGVGAAGLPPEVQLTSLAAALKAEYGSSLCWKRLPSVVRFTAKFTGQTAQAVHATLKAQGALSFLARKPAKTELKALGKLRPHTRAADTFVREARRALVAFRGEHQRAPTAADGPAGKYFDASLQGITWETVDVVATRLLED